MDRRTFESQKAFAGEKKASMQRRCVDNDYTARRMYMITMVTEERKPLFGKVVGDGEAFGQGTAGSEASLQQDVQRGDACGVCCFSTATCRTR